jgi:monoterpene epsilon-lactone hydrolase
MSKDQRDQIDAMLRSAAFDVGAPPEQLRAAFKEFMGESPLPDGVTASDAELGGRPALRLDPASPVNGSARLLYFHGGGFVFGSAASARAITAALVQRIGVSAISLDYRLAPEHPYPAAIEDGVAAYTELLESGVQAESIVLVGDSAGGGLTVTTLLAAQDAGLPIPAGLVAFSPYLDLTGAGASRTTKEAIDPLFSRPALETLSTHYLAGQDPAQPLLSPAVHADPTGLPPMLLQVGTHEMLLDDATLFATRAAAADVSVTLDVVASVTHVFQGFAGMLDEADAALDRAASFVREHLALATTA